MRRRRHRNEATHRSSTPSADGRRARVIPFPKRGSEVECRGPGIGKRLTILVVEDHSSLCEMLSLYFMRYGYHVRTAAEGDSALSVLRSEEIHVVLLDLMLPGTDGLTVLRRIRQESPNGLPYVIVVSAGRSSQDRTLVLQLGANEYLPKPFHLMRLLERVQHVERTLQRGDPLPQT